MKIGAIGIRTKIIVGDAATWHLVKKYLDNIVIKNDGVTPEERAKLENYPEIPEVPAGYYLADDGTFKALPDFVTDREMIDYVGSEMAAGSVVIKEYVDQQDALKVDKVVGKGLSTEDYTTAEKSKVSNVPLNTNSELGLKVDKVLGNSLVPDAEINKLAEYPEFEDLEFSHANLTYKNSEAAFQHVDERINEIPAVAGAASYVLLNRRQNLITGTLPNGVNSTLTLPALVAGERNEVILHFKTNSVAAPTLVYSGFTPAWLNGSAISMKVNKQYTIVFERINGIVKTSWGEY